MLIVMPYLWIGSYPAIGLSVLFGIVIAWYSVLRIRKIALLKAMGIAVALTGLTISLVTFFFLRSFGRMLSGV